MQYDVQERQHQNIMPTNTRRCCHKHQANNEQLPRQDFLHANSQLYIYFLTFPNSRKISRHISEKVATRHIGRHREDDTPSTDKTISTPVYSTYNTYTYTPVYSTYNTYTYINMHVSCFSLYVRETLLSCGPERKFLYTVVNNHSTVPTATAVRINKMTK